MVPLEIPLGMLEYLKMEKNYVPWLEASRQINYLDVFLQETDVYDIFKVGLYCNAYGPTVPCENASSSICGQLSANRIMDTFKFINGEQMSGCDIAHAQDESEYAFCACSKTAFCLAYSFFGREIQLNTDQVI